MRFFHIREIGINDEILAQGGTTVAIRNSGATSEPGELIKDDVIQLDIGIAHCHDEDNYNKKIGRDICLGRIKPTQLTVTSAFKDESDIYYRLANESMILFIRVNNGKVFVVSACQK